MSTSSAGDFCTTRMLSDCLAGCSACPPTDPPLLTAPSPLVARELEAVVKSGLSKWLLLVSDKRGSAAVPFDHIIDATPKELMKARGAGGVYDTVCSPHLAVTTALLSTHVQLRST